MAEWTHFRYGPDGNAVSADQLVGPPQRIRWLAGPMVHASNIVTAGGGTVLLLRNKKQAKVLRTIMEAMTGDVLKVALFIAGT